MSANIWLVLASVLGGALIAAQGPIYARMALAFDSSIVATMLAFVIATAAISIIVLATRTPMPTMDQLATAPKWVWLGAFVGVFQVLVAIAAVPKLGVGPFVLLVVFGQVVAAQLYDQFGWFELEQRSINFKSIAGVLLMMTGLALVFSR